MRSQMERVFKRRKPKIARLRTPEVGGEEERKKKKESREERRIDRRGGKERDRGSMMGKEKTG